MRTVTSISGGQTSAYLAANFPTEYNIFALVRIEDEKCRFPDEVLRRRVEDRIQKDFIGTAEDDMIIYTIFDLEQYLGREIKWVSGLTYEQAIKNKGGYLPNIATRYCTSVLKLIPMLEWWYHNHAPEPFEMQIGYRANEEYRILNMKEVLNQNGVLEMKHTFHKHPSGRNKWELFAWEKPTFPLFDARIYKSDIVKYWQDKPVRFAKKNNCIGCFHRHPLVLKKMQQLHPAKFHWFVEQENGRKKGTWRSDTTYERIEKFHPQHEINFDDFSGCDSGFCEIH